MNVRLAVNGTLMRRFALNGNLTAVGASFTRETTTPGLCVGKVRLIDGEETLGVLGEPAICQGQREITEYGGWHAYLAPRDPE